MLLDDVRAALEERADLVPAAALEPRATLVRVRRRYRRRRVTRAATSVIVLALVIAGVAILVGTHNSSSDRVVAISSPRTTATTQPEPRPTLSDEQLNAHDGAGVTREWDPIDFGAARVFVPGDWTFEDGGECIGGSTAIGMASTGKLAQGNCTPANQFAVPADAAALIPLSGPATGPVVRVVHGYRVYRPDTVGTDVRWTFYDVPQLGVEVALRGTQQDQILDTLAPSSRAVALAYAKVPPTAGHVVAGDGVRLTIPTTWAVSTPAYYPCYLFPSSPGEPPALLRMRPNMGALGCPFIMPNLSSYLGDGVELFTSTAPDTTTPPADETPIIVFRHETTTVRVYSEGSNPRMLEVFFKRDGSSHAHLLYLGLGRNGRVAGEVLASIEAVT